MQSKEKLRIAIDCRIEDPRQGIGTAVQSLAHAFSELPSTDQEYTFIVHDDLKTWLAPHIFGPCRLVGIPKPKPSKLKEGLRHIVPLRSMRDWLPRKVPAVPQSDGYAESQRFDLVHFPTQVAYITPLPTIYQPWDLQHLHYPEFFTPLDVRVRERLYRAFCDQARVICVQTRWSEQDLIAQYKISPEKIAVIPWGSVLDAHEPPSQETIRSVASRLRLPEQFFFYPAATWVHKNHIVILRALQILKARDGRAIDVYFSGKSTAHRSKLESAARELGITEQVHYLGFVSTEELQAIFATATAMIFASKFEGFGLPILEAFHARLPVLCSDATVLPEVAGDGALYFAPHSAEQLANGMRSVLDDAQLRQDLISKGSQVLRRHTMRDTALGFQALYQRVVREAVEDTAEPGVHAAINEGRLNAK